MTYNRIATPRMYMDRLSFDLANGFKTISSYTLTNDNASPGTVTPSSGVIEDLFDLRPSNFITVAANTQAFRINVDTGLPDTLAETNYLAILGHNLEYANAVFKFEYTDNADYAAHTGTNVEFATPSTDYAIHGTGGGCIFEDFEVGNVVTVTGSTSNDGTYTILSMPDDDTLYVDDTIVDESAGDTVTVTTVTLVTTTGNHTKLINAAADDTAGWINPANNGWTLITWTDAGTTGTNQYKRLTIEDDAGGAGSDFDQPVQLGAIMLGEYIDFPNSPDLDVGFSIDYDGTKLLTSAGGNTFAASSYLGSPGWAKTNPWVNATASSENADTTLSRHYGRRKYDMNFSYVADTNLFLSNMHAAHGAMIDGSDLYSQFYHKALGQHIPFLFTIDSASTSEGDYGLYRLADSEMKTRQVAHQAWNTSLSLVESW